MPQWLTDCLGAMAMKPYASTTGHRNAERVNAGLQLAAYTFHNQPYALITTKLGQCISSFYSLFRSDTVFPEKIIHLLQFAIAGTQLGIASTLLFNKTTCSISSDAELCLAQLYLESLYNGTLGIGWLPSEFSKQPYQPPIPVNALPV